MNGHLSKPISSEQLYSMIRAHISDSPKQTAQLRNTNLPTVSEKHQYWKSCEAEHH